VHNLGLHHVILHRRIGVSATIGVQDIGYAAATTEPNPKPKFLLRMRRSHSEINIQQVREHVRMSVVSNVLNADSGLWADGPEY